MGVLLKTIFTGLAILWLWQQVRRWFALQAPERPYQTPPRYDTNSGASSPFQSSGQAANKPKRRPPEDDYIDYEELP